MDDARIQEVKSELGRFIEDAEYIGWDPYDTLNTSWKILKKGKWPPVLAIQLQKRSPVDLRKTLRIKPGVNPKTLALMQQSYALEGKEDKFAQLIADLKEVATPGYKGYCWGYHFDWASPVKFLPAYSPTIVVSGFVSQALVKCYDVQPSEEVKEMLQGISTFIREELAWTKHDIGKSVSYSTVAEDVCYNASLLGAQHFGSMFRLFGEERDAEDAKALVDFVVSKQQANGCWNYSMDLRTGKERKQVDFHQGYVIDSIDSVVRDTGHKNAEVLMAIEKGLDFYATMQFDANGLCLYRWPKRWPLDIHNQSQGIITFARGKRWSHQYMDLSRKILEATINQLWNAKGYFEYRKYPMYKMRTPMMRWAQAWMYLAITEYQRASE